LAQLAPPGPDADLRRAQPQLVVLLPLLVLLGPHVELELAKIVEGEKVEVLPLLGAPQMLCALVPHDAGHVPEPDQMLALGFVLQGAPEFLGVRRRLAIQGLQHGPVSQGHPGVGTGRRRVLYVEGRRPQTSRVPRAPSLPVLPGALPVLLGRLRVRIGEDVRLDQFVVRFERDFEAGVGVVRCESLGRELLLGAEGFAHNIEVALHLREGHRALLM
jgi:hypothetical protein